METVFILIVFFMYMLFQGFLVVMILVKIGERKGDDPVMEELRNIKTEIMELKNSIRLISGDKG